MRSFEWIDATSVTQAARLLAASTPDQPVVAKAGGVDLVDLMKEGIVRPSRIINLRSIGGLDTIDVADDGGVTLGALVTLAQIEASAEIRRRLPALSDAARHAATPQVRNAATIGGNLMQRPRCWYLRSALFHQSAADVAAAVVRGEHQYHAIFDNEQSAIVHASTPATALVAYDADVELTAAEGTTRIVAVSDFLLPPDPARDRDTAIRNGELLTHVRIPPRPATLRVAYHKQTERESYDWPICDVAVALDMDARTVRQASIVLGWVAPTPRRASESEAALNGRDVSDALAREAGKAAIAGATPLPKNSYKLQVLEAVVRRTILAAAAASAADSHA
jgi:xanthine dehydrogenase YagS FAD-binding subunit